MTFQGVRFMQQRFESGLYGCCPRVGCNRQHLLPIGLSPNPGEFTVKTFCPLCNDVYDTECQLDGSFFGPYFPHFFIQALKDDLHIGKPNPTELSFLGIPIDETSEMNRCKYVHNFH
ncbi:Casein kinase II regulatory subunit family protein [Histomonas meleagridis]|uniref:Casein kinase II regulatory subunit family protein n=1 Tax=Histomonas meleagridis TaxID=135588 RepID=UPI00355999C9|nr:Casein kinase II regulatory subunit family protein [Histomonas meleagridis]KAH0801956.1 Casein kinase II regulatory subunit family protein [Histomonas meleagridis]